MAYSDCDFSNIGSFVNPHTGRVSAVQLRELSGRVDVLRERLWILDGCDKSLMETYLEGISFRKIARIAGVNEATVARRVGRISKRLMDATYIICLRNSDVLGKENVEIARDLLVRGVSQREIARKRNVSIYRVRKVMAEVRRLATRVKGEGERGKDE